MTREPEQGERDAFSESRTAFETVAAWLGGDEAAGLEHAELERRVEVDGRELLRRLFQDHLDLRAQNETRLDTVVDADGVERGSVEAGHCRTLATVFGDVVVRRLAYRQRGVANLHPADAVLNLPLEKHSHGLRRLAAVESSRGSFDDARGAIERATGQVVGKRQLKKLALRAACDFEEFYALRPRVRSDPDDVLVISADGKGVVMRPEALRAATVTAASRASAKLSTRLSKGEKRNRKRMAEVGTVYDAAPVIRAPTDILGKGDDDRRAPPAPLARNKWLTASVVDDAATVVAQLFDEAERRDPRHRRTWVGLVDGNNHQIERIGAEATERGVDVAIVCDFIHVLEYLWSAAWCFYDEGDPASGPTSTTPPPWPQDGRSQRASSKAPVVTSFATGWTSRAHAGASRAPRPS